MASKDSTPEDRQLIASEEGRVAYVYDDAYSPPRKWKKGTTVKGNLTAGVGHLLSANEIATWVGKSIPANVIDQWLDDDLNSSEDAVARYVKVPITPHMRGSLISLDFNIGDGNFSSSTLVKKLNAKDYDGALKQFLNWTKTTIVKNGKRVKVDSSGLKARRLKEMAYWQSGTLPAASPSAKTGTIAPKATEIAQATPKATSPLEIGGLAVTGVSALGTVASADGFIAYVIGGLLVAAFIVGILWVAKRQFFPK